MSYTRKITTGLAIAAIACFAATGCGGSSKSGGSGGKVTLTLWHNYGTGANATATNDLAKAFETAHPDITVKVVSQPSANYFQLLSAAWVAGTAPDLSVEWTGLFDTRYESQLLNLKPYFTSAQLGTVNGANWASTNFSTSQGLLVMPLENQFYMAYYNKSLFKKAGIPAVPRDWSQLHAACTKLNKIGVTPIVYGADPQGIGPEPYPWYDLSYMMGAVSSPAQWRGFYDGQIPWTSSKVLAEASAWAALPKEGCTNKDVLTKTNILGAFTTGKAAMIMDGSWDAAALQKAMGAKVAPMVPPYSATPQHNVVQFSGDGFSVSKASHHIPQAVEFVKFLMTAQAQKIIANAGLIPDLKGYRAKDSLQNQMLAFASKDKFTVYPMLDNVVQSGVVSTGQNQLDAALGGDSSASAALAKMKATLDALPSDQRGSTYH